LGQTLNTTRWKILADAVRGTSHNGTGQPCQDAWLTSFCGTNERTIVATLSDGAGSAAFAEIGASLTCESIISSISERLAKHPTVTQFTRATIVQILNEARIELIDQAESRKCDIRDFACTSLIAIVDPEIAVFAQLGDGAIVLSRADQYEPAFWPQEGEYANTTNFLTDINYSKTVEFKSFIEPIHEFSMFSDGLQRLALDYSTRLGHVGFFRPLFQRLAVQSNPDDLRPLFRQFLDSPRINDRTDDDKTLVLATRRETDGTAHQSS